MDELGETNLTARLIEIAKIQRALFDCVFDFETHSLRSVEKPKKRLFRRAEPDEYGILSAELERLKKPISGEQAVNQKVRWWTIPWEEVAGPLYVALLETRRENGWRFETTVNGFRENDGVHYVILAEEGASQSFTSEKIYQYEELSPFSEEERTERMKRYDHAVEKSYRDLAFRADLQNAFIRSSVSSKLYKDIADYYTSEGRALDSMLRSNYEDQMYVDQVIEGRYATAVSRRSVRGLFAVGTYLTDRNGRLRAFQSADFAPLVVSPENMKSVLVERRHPGAAVLKLCEFIADDNDVKTVPYSLLSGVVNRGQGTNLDFLRLQSALFTLLAGKLDAA